MFIFAYASNFTIFRTPPLRTAAKQISFAAVILLYLLMDTYHQFLIAAPSSGAGKTTTTIGLLRALHNRGLEVQAFKSGPDYIDPKFHALATGKSSINLDQFFCNQKEILDLFQHYSANKQVSVVEGVMGLFDGFAGRKGSSADLAKMLNIPVVLVVNGASVAHSIAALLYGFKHFDPELNIAGVIFNKVSSQSHYRIMQEAAASVGLTALGHVPRKADIHVPSRHLGLNIDTQYRFTQYADTLAEHIASYVDIDLLLQRTQVQNKPFVTSISTPPLQTEKEATIAVAKDEAFNFIYPATIRLFERMGKVVFFSPMRDTTLPQADYLYLPGGYPELYIDILASNTSMLQAIKHYANAGGRVLAECGGMIYLCQEMIDEQGKAHPLVGVLPTQATMQNMKLKLGYRQFSYQGTDYKGHEFHYSSLLPNEQVSVCQLYGAKGQAVNTKLFRTKNVVAGYTHLYLKDIEAFETLFENGAL